MIKEIFISYGNTDFYTLNLKEKKFTLYFNFGEKYNKIVFYDKFACVFKSYYEPGFVLNYLDLNFNFREEIMKLIRIVDIPSDENSCSLWFRK